MIETGSGLILRTRPLTETSLIVQWLTPQFGRIATVAKGARRPKSPFQGKLDLFFSADFSLQRSRRSELHALREVNLRETRPILRRRWDLLRQAAYAARLVEQATESETPLPEIFELLNGFLDHLCAQSAGATAVFAFETRLLSELGLQSDSENEKLGPDIRPILKLLQNGEWSALSRLKMTERQSASIRHHLHGFILFHLGRIPTGRDACLQAQGD